MVADKDALRFYVDESALGLGKAIAVARRDTVHVGHKLVLPDCHLGVLDTVWIPYIASRDLIVICRDKKLRTKPGEISALMASGLRVFCIGGKRDLPTWEWLARIVKHWDRMEGVIASRGPGPWIYMINENGLSEFKPSTPSP